MLPMAPRVCSTRGSTVRRQLTATLCDPLTHLSAPLALDGSSGTARLADGKAFS